MDRTIHIDFAKFEVDWDIIALSFLKLREIWILTKFGGYSLKIGPTNYKMTNSKKVNNRWNYGAEISNHSREI